MSIIPVVALVGQKNVGKSTLFNRLTRTQDALVADYPGLTRDRQYGFVECHEKKFIVVDTGGIGEEKTEMDHLVTAQVEVALSEANLILFVVDAHVGLTTIDEMLVERLRKFNKPIQLVINKMDGVSPSVATGDFFQLGIGNPAPISAAHGHGISELLEYIYHFLKWDELVPDTQVHDTQRYVRVAVVGRPNVGKSTLINRILGEERVLVSSTPGTTRDSIFIPFERDGKKFTLIDTAGIRRRGKISDKVEKFSVIKTMQSIDACDVVVFLVDAQETITEQDLKLLGLVLEAGRALVIAINKWDGLSEDQREKIKKELDRRLTFINFAEIHFISARHGTGVGNLFASIQNAFASATQELSTPKLTRILQQLIDAHQIPIVRNKRIRLRYAHTGGHRPPIIIIHGDHTGLLPGSYQKYLENGFRQALNLVGTPLRLQFK